MKKSFFTTNRFHYVIFYFILFSFFFLFAGLECKNEEDEPPVDPFKADFNVIPESGTIDTIFKFDPSGSISTVRNPINKYYWDFNNNGNPDVSTDNAKIVTHQFTQEGVYPVKLIVTTPYDVKDSMTKNVSVAGADNCFDDFHVPCPDQPTVTLAGRAYKTVKIGDQCWFAEDVNFGVIVKITDTPPSDNGTVEKFCYEDNPANCEKYGGLYTWNEAMDYKNNPGAIGICPVGWHIPTQADWDELASVLGGYDVAGRKMMSCENDPWEVVDLNNNSSGFTAYPSGKHWIWWEGLEETAHYWTSDSYDSYYVFTRYLHREEDVLLGTVSQDYYSKDYAFSVRCVRD